MNSVSRQQLIDNTTMKNALWITWEVQVRNRSMSKMLDIPLAEIVENRSRSIKYPILLYKTLKVLYKNNVKLLFVQNPSIVLSLFAVCLKLTFGLRVVVDSHNAGIFPLEGNSRFLSFFARFIARYSDVTIVSNDYLSSTVARWGGRPYVIPDPVPLLVPIIPTIDQIDLKPYVLFICTWADDEPYLEVIKAAEKLTGEIEIYITGNYHKRLNKELVDSLPDNVRLLGFVSETDYVSYFSQALAAIDLTTRENCLVCGGYEALALSVPCIISDTRINREVFAGGFVYAENNSNAIVQAVREVIRDAKRLREAVVLQCEVHKAVIENKIIQFRKEFF